MKIRARYVYMKIHVCVVSNLVFELTILQMYCTSVCGIRSVRERKHNMRACVMTRSDELIIALILISCNKLSKCCA